MPPVILGVDVGGTFTDAALLAGDRLFVAKAPTTPADQSEGVMRAVDEALQRAGAGPGDVERFVHGMTVATNALLEGRVARTALLVTEGFTDIEELGRQARAELYRLCASRPPPLVPVDLRVPVPERTGPEGVLTALDEEELRGRLRGLDFEAAAVCLLWGFRHPDHERRAAALVEECRPGAHVSTSHETAGVFREYERCATTVVDASLSPLMHGYLERLIDRCRGEGLPAPEVMLSSGGAADAATAGRHAAWTVLSGPAGGAVGAARVGERVGAGDAVGLDMGGTSCDVSVALGGGAAVGTGREVGGRALALPMVDVHTVGAGGGSIAWRDAGGVLRVGPRSAGADPGPACYGRGGRSPTVTDADLLLGRLAEDSPLAGGVRLDRAAAEARAVRARRGARAVGHGDGGGRGARGRRGDGGRGSGGHRGAGHRPAGPGARGLRRRGSPARGGDRRGAGDAPRGGAHRRRRALGPRARALGAPSRRGGERPAHRRRAHRRERGAKPWTAWAPRHGHGSGIPPPSCA